MTSDFKIIKEQVVVITGASSGLGAGIALAIAERGGVPVLAARRSDLLVELQEKCAAHGVNALIVQTDVSIHTQIDNLLARALEKYGRIDSWINNAGVGVIGPFDEVPFEDHQKVIETNLLGTMYGSHAAMKLFRRQGSGNLINIASMLGRVPAPYYASYITSKHGIIGLSATLRSEIAEQKLENLHVCTVLPMAMNTPFFEHAANYTGNEAVPIPPVYDVDNGIDAVIGLLEKPQAEVIVGGAGVLADLAHKIVPGLTEKISAIEVQKVQMDGRGKIANTTGSLYQPIASGNGLRMNEN